MGTNTHIYEHMHILSPKINLRAPTSIRISRFYHKRSNHLSYKLMLHLMNENKTTIRRCQCLSNTKCSWHLFCQVVPSPLWIILPTHLFLLDFKNKETKNFCNDKEGMSYALHTILTCIWFSLKRFRFRFPSETFL